MTDLDLQLRLIKLRAYAFQDVICRYGRVSVLRCDNGIEFNHFIMGELSSQYKYVEIASFEAHGYCHKVADSSTIRYFIPCFPVLKRDSDLFLFYHQK